MAWARFGSKAKYLSIAFGVIAGLLVLYAVHSANGFASFPFDDAWIHLTFARTLASTGRFAYGAMNPATSGSTSPLFTFLEAILFLLSSNEFVVSLIVSIGAFAVAAYFFYLLVRESSSLPWFPLVGMLLFLLFPSLLVISNWGMETGLVIALLLWSLYAYRRERWTELAIALGLAIWARPDTLVLAATIGIDLLYIRKTLASRPRIRSLVIFFAIVAGYVGFNLLLSHTPLPNTFYAKLAYYKSGNGTFYAALWQLIAGGGKIVAFLFAIAGIAWTFGRKQRGNLILVLYPVGMVLLYHWKLPYLYQDGRYLIPIVPFILLLALIGVARTSAWILKSAVAASVLAILILFIAVGAADSGMSDAVDNLAFEGSYIHNLQVTTAEWCSTHLPAHAAITTHDIGAMGFYSHRKVIDLVGLADPDMIPYLDKPGVANAARKKGASFAALLDNWYEIPNENSVFVDAPSESETMRVYNFTDSSRFTGAKVLSIHKYMENVLRGDDPSSLGEAIRQSVATEPDNALTYTLAGEILLKTGRKNEAKNELEQALQLFPNSERAKQDMIAAMQGIHSSQ
ncbi:MAG TPA: hypothetical protein VGM92_04585 [Candidatus Kapabacteria bacterium]